MAKRRMRHSKVIQVKTSTGTKITWFPNTRKGQKEHRTFMRQIRKTPYGKGATSRKIGVTTHAARRARGGR